MRVATRPNTCPAASTTNHPPPCSISSVSRPRGTYVRMRSVTPFHVETNVNDKGYSRVCQREFPCDSHITCLGVLMVWAGRVDLVGRCAGHARSGLYVIVQELNEQRVHLFR